MSQPMTDDIRPVHEHVISLLEPAGARAVLDLGCGRGEHLRMLAETAPPDVRLVGVDASQKAIDAAREATEGDPRFHFLVHDLAEGLPFGDQEFDRVLSVNVLEAIVDKSGLIREAHRVIDQEGRLVVAHFDFDTQLYDGVDKQVVRTMTHAFADWKLSWMDDADGWMGRRLWRAFQGAGLFEGQVDAHVHTSTTFEPGCYGWERAQDFASMVRRSMVTAEAYAGFCQGLEDLAARDEYFYAITMFSYVGTKA